MSLEALHVALAEVSIGCRTILDVGAGTRRLQRHLWPEAVVTSIDAYEPDLRSPEPVRGPIIVDYVEDWIVKCPDKAFDLVLACDVLEHFPEDIAQALVLPNLKRIGRKVALFVPEGEHPQPGTPENPLQAHRSTWYMPDFLVRGFRVRLWPDFHVDPTSAKASGAMWVVWSD